MKSATLQWLQDCDIAMIARLWRYHKINDDGVCDIAMIARLWRYHKINDDGVCDIAMIARLWR